MITEIKPGVFVKAQRAPFTDAELRSIRAMLGQHVPRWKIAKRFDTSTTSIDNIANGRTYNPDRKPKPRGRPKGDGRVGPTLKGVKHHVNRADCSCRRCQRIRAKRLLKAERHATERTKFKTSVARRRD